MSQVEKEVVGQAQLEEMEEEGRREEEELVRRGQLVELKLVEDLVRQEQLVELLCRDEKNRELVAAIAQWAQAPKGEKGDAELLKATSKWGRAINKAKTAEKAKAKKAAVAKAKKALVAQKAWVDEAKKAKVAEE